MYNNIMKSESLFFKVILALEILRMCFPACKHTNTRQKTHSSCLKNDFLSILLPQKTLSSRIPSRNGLNHLLK